jgi:subtilisin family serine protease
MSGFFRTMAVMLLLSVVSHGVGAQAINNISKEGRLAQDIGRDSAIKAALGMGAEAAASAPRDLKPAMAEPRELNEPRALKVPQAPGVAQPVLPKLNSPLLADAAVPLSALADQPTHEPGQLILALPTEGPATWGEWAAGVRGVLRAQVRLEGLGLNLAVMQFESDRQAREAAIQLVRDHPGLIADLHARAYAQQAGAIANEPTEQPAARHYAQGMVLGDAPQNRRCAAKVGIIDTSLLPDSARTRLALNSLMEKRFISPMDKPASPEHGTAVAAVLAGQALIEGPGRGFRSAAPGVDLYQAAVMRQEQGFATTNTLALAMAMNWLSGQKVDVINMSLAASGDRVLALSVDRVLAQGITLVAAVGPGVTAPALVYPAAYPGVLAVGAIDAAGRPFAQTLRAPYVGISAPGVEVWLPVPHAKESQGNAGTYYSGSSFAAPWVTGLVAQIRARAWVNAPSKVLPALCAMARPWSPPAPSGQGCGMLSWAPQKVGTLSR